MRKRNCDKLFDNILWYTVYLLPILYTLVMCSGLFKNFTFENFEYISLNTSYADYGFFNLLTETLQSWVPNGFVFDAFIDVYLMFSNGPFYSPVIPYYLTWLVYVTIGHLLVDFILFIPRLAHKWMNMFTQGD